MRKQIKMHEAQTVKSHNPGDVPSGAVPAYLLDREGENKAKILSNTVKQKRKEKSGRWSVPIPSVKPMTEEEMFRVVRSGKR
jgi:ribosome biogenesis protein NSA2